MDPMRAYTRCQLPEDSNPEFYGLRMSEDDSI